MTTQSDWVTAVIILAAGLILGVLFIYASKSRKGRTLSGEADARKELEARRDALLDQLRDPATPASERERLEQETAVVLRELDDAPARAPRVTEEGAAAPAAPLGQAAKGFAWGMLTFAVLGGLGWFVMQKAAPRNAPAMTEAADPAVQQQAVAVPTDAQIQQLEALVKADPKNVSLLNDLARAHLERGDLMGVHTSAKAALDVSPEDSRALTMEAVVRSAMGESELAISLLQRASKNDPSNLDARVALAWVYAQYGQLDAAQKTIDVAINDVPAEKAMLAQVMQQIRTRVAAETQKPAVTRPVKMPAGHPPVNAAGGAKPATPAGHPAGAAGR